MLFSPLNGKATYISRRCAAMSFTTVALHPLGEPAPTRYLLENGNLLWAGRLLEGAAAHGRARRADSANTDWNGKVLWEHKHVGQHHDFRRRLPNGNTISSSAGEVVPPEIEQRIPERFARARCIPTAACTATPFWRSPRRAKTYAGWHACWPRHGGGELSRSGPKPGFATSSPTPARYSPLPNGDIYISFRRLNMIGLIDRQTLKDEMEHRDDSFGMQHDCVPLPNGNITLFANSINTTTNPFSRVIELDPRTHKTVWEISRQARLHVLQSAHQRRAARRPAATR